jgi:hypothetical protein
MANLVVGNDLIRLPISGAQVLIDDPAGKFATRQREQHSTASEGVDEGARITDRENPGQLLLPSIGDRTGSMPFSGHYRLFEPLFRDRIGVERQVEQLFAVATRFEERLSRSSESRDSTALLRYLRGHRTHLAKK